MDESSVLSQRNTTVRLLTDFCHERPHVQQKLEAMLKRNARVLSEV